MPKYRVTGPDGATYSIDAPNDEAMQAAVQQMFQGAGGEQSAPAKPASTPQPVDPSLPIPGTPIKEYKPPSLVDNIMGGLNYAAGTGAVLLDQVRRGAANTAGLAVDAVNAAPMLLNLIPGVHDVGPISKNPVGGSRSLDEALRLGGVIPEVQPSDGFQKVVGRVGQELGAAAVPALGILGKTASMTAQEARALPPLAKFFGADKAAIDPAKYVADEAFQATAAGTGAGLVNTVVDPNSGPGQLADAGGAVAGSTAGSIGRGLVRGGRDIINAVFGNGDYVDQVVKETVADRLIREAGLQNKPGEIVDTQPFVDKIDSGRRVSADVPGFQESLADRTKNSGIAALEYGRQTGPNAGMFRQRAADNTAAVDAAMAQSKPDGQPGALRSALDAEREARISAAVADTADAQRSFDRAMENLQIGTANETARGSDIRAVLEDAHQKARNYERSVWEAASTSEPVDLAPLSERFKAVDQGLTDVERAKYRPGEADIPASRVKKETTGDTPDIRGMLDPEARATYDAIMGSAAKEPGAAMVPANEVTSLRSALTTDIRNATSGLEPDENKARILGKYVAAIDDYINTTPELAGRFDKAREVSKDINNRFNRAQTAIAQTLAKNGGVYQADASSIPRKFVQPDSGRVTDFGALLKEAQGDPQAMVALHDQIIADAKAAGAFENPEKLNRFLADRSVMLSEFPALKKDLMKAGAARAGLDAATAAENDLRSSLTQQGKSAVANYLQYGDENATRAMKTVIGSKDPARSMDELLSFVGDDKKAVEGARKVFWDIMEEKTRAGGRTTGDINGAQPWSPYALNKFLNDPVNNALLERLYRDNPEHLDNVRKIAEAIQGTETRNSAKAPNTSGTSQGVNNILTPETLQSRLYAYKSGKISGTFLLTSILAVVARRSVGAAQREGVGRMLDQALLNPDVASLLLKENNPANRKALGRWAKAWWGNQASSIINAMSGAEQNDDSRLKDQIMSGGQK